MSLADALVEMSRKGFGMTTIVEESIIGVFTDGICDAAWMQVRIFTLPESQTSCRQNLSTFLPAP